MEKKLAQSIAQLNEEGWHELKLNIDTAEYARHIIKTYNLTQSDFVVEMDIDVSDYKAFINGGYPYTIKDLAKLRAVDNYLHAKKQKLITNK